MLGLIYKEFIAIKKQFIPIFIVMLFFSGLIIVACISSYLEEWEVNLTLCFSSLVIMLVVEMFQQGVFEHDERKVWLSFIGSTSHGIQKQVLSKYAFQLILSAAVFAWCSVFFLCAKFIENNCNIELSFKALQIFLWIQIFSRAVENPFLMRFGSKKGNMIRVTVTGILVLAILIHELFWKSLFNIEALIDLAKSISENDRIFWIMPIVSLTLLVISYFISCPLYIKGGESYEK